MLEWGEGVTGPGGVGWGEAGRGRQLTRNWWAGPSGPAPAKAKWCPHAHPPLQQQLGQQQQQQLELAT